MLNCSQTSNLASSPPSAARISTILMNVSPLGWNEIQVRRCAVRLQRGSEVGCGSEYESHIHESITDPASKGGLLGWRLPRQETFSALFRAWPKTLPDFAF